MAELLSRQEILPGIKVDTGGKPGRHERKDLLKGSMACGERLKEYHENSVRALPSGGQ